MKKTNYLNTEGTVLDNEKLDEFMEKLAINYDVSEDTHSDTYPIQRLDNNYELIEKTYELLNEHIKQGIDVYPAGEWLLDNFYIIEETVKKIEKEMSIKKYAKLPSIINGIYKGYARIYVIANEMISYRDSKIDEDTIKISLVAYQKHKKLNMEEIWNLWIFLEIAIIEKIRNVCEKIYISQIQKQKVEDIIKRLIDNKNSDLQVKNRLPFSEEFFRSI